MPQTSGTWTVLGWIDYSFVKGDICDQRVVDRLVRNSDAVVNFAAETHVDNSIANQGPFISQTLWVCTKYYLGQKTRDQVPPGLHRRGVRLFGAEFKEKVHRKLQV